MLTPKQVDQIVRFAQSVVDGEHDRAGDLFGVVTSSGVEDVIEQLTGHMGEALSPAHMITEVDVAGAMLSIRLLTTQLRVAAVLNLDIGEETVESMNMALSLLCGAVAGWVFVNGRQPNVELLTGGGGLNA